MIPISIFILLFLFLTINQKIHFFKARSLASKLEAVVVFYKMEKGPKWNDFTKLDYPYVKLSNSEEDKLIKLNYANNWSRPFEIGETTTVFWLEGKLIYWDAHRKGMLKHFYNYFEY